MNDNSTSDSKLDEEAKPKNFIASLIEQELAEAKINKVVTRFPPCLLYTSDAADE